MMESLWNGVRMAQGGFRLGTDSVLLAHFAQFPPRSRVADLGAGDFVILFPEIPMICNRSESTGFTLDSTCELKRHTKTFEKKEKSVLL